MHPGLRLNGQALTAYRYGKFDQRQRLRFVLDVLLERAADRGLRELSVTRDSVERTATRWAQRLAHPAPPPRAFATQPAVLWLVGGRIGDGALRQIRRWRAAGVDARTLALQVRRHPHGWLLRIGREHAPQRTEIEKNVVADLARRADQPRVQLELYEVVNPSASKARGGKVLSRPHARIEDVPVVVELGGVTSG